MKKIVSFMMVVCILVLSTFCTSAQEYVTMYAADGRTRQTLVSEVEAYKKVGWYIEPVVKMYAADGRTRYTLKSEVEAYKKVGWYTERPTVTMYAADGRTRQTLTYEVEAYKKVGWYTEPVIKMYAPNGRTRYTLKSEVNAYRKVGWYVPLDFVNITTTQLYNILGKDYFVEIMYVPVIIYNNHPFAFHLSLENYELTDKIGEVDVTEGYINDEIYVGMTKNDLEKILGTKLVCEYNIAQFFIDGHRVQACFDKQNTKCEGFYIYKY